MKNIEIRIFFGKLSLTRADWFRGIFFKNWNMLDHHDFATFEWHSRIMNRSTKIFVHGLFSKNRTFVREMLYWVFIKIPGSSWCWEDLERKGIRMPHTSATGQICWFSRLHRRFRGFGRNAPLHYYLPILKAFFCQGDQTSENCSPKV